MPVNPDEVTLVELGSNLLRFEYLVSLEGSPLHVGSPQGVSSVRLYGSLNCTLYKYVHTYSYQSPFLPFLSSFSYVCTMMDGLLTVVRCAIERIYRTETCEPDTPANGHIVPGKGESRLYGGAGPGDPDAIDDRTVAFRCRKPMGPRVPKKPQSVPFLA